MANAAVTKEQLQSYFSDEEDRRALNRRAEDLGKKNEIVKKKLIDHVRRHGGADRTTTLHGFTLALKEVAGTPQWREEFIRALGDDGIDRAEAVRQRTPPVDRLSVTKSDA